MNTSIMNPIQINIPKPKFEPIQGNILVRGIKRTALCVKIEAIALKAIVYHIATLVSIVVRTPFAIHLCSGLGKILFKDHLTLLGQAIKTTITAPKIACRSASSRESSLKLQLSLFVSPKVNKENLFKDACNNGDLKTIEMLLASGVKDVSSAFTAACMKGHTHMITRLVELGADLETKNKDGTNVLILAARSGHTNTVVKLVEMGANLEAKNRWGGTALSSAAAWGQTDTLLKLIELGADLKIKTKKGSTLLHLAAENGKTDMIAKLVDLGADLNAQNNKGNTPLHLAAKYSKKTATKLVELGANLKAKNRNGNTPLDVANLYIETEDTANSLVALGAKSGSPGSLWQRWFG